MMQDSRQRELILGFQICLLGMSHSAMNPMLASLGMLELGRSKDNLLPQVPGIELDP